MPKVAAHYRDNGVKWAVVAGDNYGEGSSREAAALSPRYMGGFAVLANSMARIHETVGAHPTAKEAAARADNAAPSVTRRI